VHDSRLEVLLQVGALLVMGGRAFSTLSNEFCWCPPLVSVQRL